MDLRGTELVVLSACETGLGDLRTGEGVFGLRRGVPVRRCPYARHQSLPGPGCADSDMMKDFYISLKRGKSKLQALHEARLEVIRKRRKEHAAAHPFFWASFVLVGDPR